jgi:hypothetical protein
MNVDDKRLDFCIEEAGCLIWVAPRSLGGLSPSTLADVWEGKAQESVATLVRRAAMMPMSLYQDDGYSVRIVVGDLTPQEETEWVARVDWKLHVPCGEVLVSGILTPDFEREFAEIVPAEHGGSYWAGAYVSVPPGEYRVEVLSYPPGDLSSGWGMMTNSRTFGRHPTIKPEKPLDYFKRTRPGATPPPWITDEPDDGPPYIDMIVRLSPLEEEPSTLPSFEDDSCIQWEFRKPDICPIGIRSTIES